MKHSPGFGRRYHRAALGLAAPGLALLLLGCNARSPQTTDSNRAEAIPQFGEGMPESSAASPGSGVPELEPPLPALDGPHYSAFDLLHNRPLAHRLEFGANGAPAVAVDARTADFMRYIHGNHASDWYLDTKVDEETIAAARGSRAKLWLPTPRPEEPNILELRFYNPARGHNSITLTVNGHKQPAVQLREGWQTARIAIENPEHLRAENAITLDFGNMGRFSGNLSGGGFSWLRMGPKSAFEAPRVAQARKVDDSQADGAVEKGAVVEKNTVVEKSAVAAKIDGAEEGAQIVAAAHVEADEARGAVQERNADGSGSAGADAVVEPGLEPPADLVLAQDRLELAPGAGLAYFVWIPNDASLDLEVRADAGCGPAVSLFTEAGGGAVTRVLDVERGLVAGRGEVQSTAIALGEHAGQVARLEVRPGAGCSAPMVLERARLVVPGELPAIPADVPRPKYVLFWMIDTLRADHLPIHFDTNVQAPNLKRLADEGASFKLAYTHGSESRVSHASLFTGLFPNRHRVLARGKVQPGVPILSEYIKRSGYKTGVIGSNGYLSHLLNLNRGWDFYRNTIHEQTAVDGMSMARDGLRWAAENKDSPFFLYLGTIDPHVTYRRHEAYIGLYDTEPYHGRFQRYISGDDLGLVKARKLPVDERDRRRIHNLYKNEITFNDAAFAHMREQLEELGIWEQTAVIVTSDHGEEFWEHGSVGHGHNIHQEMVHVPFIVYYPPLIPAGTVVEAGIDSSDMLPTVLELLGIERPDNKQGKSALELIFNRHGGYPEPAIATQYMMHYALQMQQWKLYLRRGEFQLYDRSTDHFETTNVAADHPLASRWLLDSAGWFRAHRDRWDKHAWGAPSNLREGFVEQVLAGE